MHIRTDTVLIGRLHSTSRAMCSKNVNLCEKSMRCQTYAKTDDRCERTHLLQSPVQPSHFLGRMLNTTFAKLTKKSKYLMADFFCSNAKLVLAT